MFQTIQSKMVLIFLAFATLLAASGAATYYVLTQQASDAVVLNLAGRQRMLTQKITKETMLLANAAASGQTTRVSPMRDGLKQTMRVFESTLLALKDGGAAAINLDMTRMRELPAPESDETKRQVELAFSLWQPFKKNLERVLESNGTDRQAIDAVADGEDKLLTEMNNAVTLMQAHSEKKVQRLYKIQSGALAAGFLLVIIGTWVARNLISKPISDLSRAAREMSTGNLKIEFRPAGSSEVRELGASFDRMRASMLAALGGTMTAADDDV